MRELTPEEFVSAPVGGWVARRSFLVWCASPTLSGTVLWGAPDARDAGELTRLWDYDHRLSGYDFILDALRLRFVDPAAFERVSRYIGTHVERYARIVRRQVVIVPREILASSVVAGVPVVLDIKHDWRAFADLATALRWLERPEADAAYGEVLARVADGEAATEALTAVRDFLTSHPRAVSLVEVSRALARSPRTLQRHLRESGSSFRDELRRARALAAAKLLAGGDRKMEAVAADVGYASVSHFVEAFTSEMGESPLEYRRRTNARSR